MPDGNDFDHLGRVDVRCIWCSAGGPVWDWPEGRRAEHHREHEDIRRGVAVTVRTDESRARRERRHDSRFWQSTHAPRQCANPYCTEVFSPARMNRVYCSNKCRVKVARSVG